MDPAVVGTNVFAFSFGGVLLGMALQSLLPQHQLDNDSSSTVKLGIGLVATMTALVLGLVTASAKSSFDAVDSTVKQTAVDILAQDRTLARYGGETNEIRKALKEAPHQRIVTIWPAGSRQPVELDPLGRGRASQAERLTHAIRSLVPQCDAQRALQARALDHAEKLLESRWMVPAGTESSMPMPFLVILLFWLSITFASFGLFAPRNATVVATLLVCALSVASAVFLVLVPEMDTPFNGMMRVSADPSI